MIGGSAVLLKLLSCDRQGPLNETNADVEFKHLERGRACMKKIIEIEVDI